MKMKNFTRFFIPLAAILVIACNQKDKITTMIPTDAAFVLHINSSSLSSKLEWSEIQNTSWFTELYSEASDTLAKELLADPEKSGIDTKSDLIFFVKNMGSSMVIAFEGGIKDNENFQAFNNKINGTDSGPAVDGPFNILPLKNEGVVVWNDKNFVYLFSSASPSAAAIPGMNPEDENQDLMRQQKLSQDSLILIAKSYFSLGDQNLGSDERYSALLKEEGDMHMWVNSETLYSSMNAGFLSMMRFNVLFEGNVSASALNFGNGKLTMKSRQYYGKEMTDLLKDYSPKEESADVINRIPNKDVVAAFVMNYPPEGLKAFIKLIGVDGLVNGFLGNANYSVDEFIKANKGDIVIAVSDLNLATRTNEFPDQPGTGSKPDLKILFSTSVKDRAAFDKLITTIQSQVPKAQQDAFGSGLSYKLDNNWFALSNAPQYVDQFLTGGSSKPEFASKISGHPFGGYVDIQKILKTVEPDSSETSVIGSSANFWKDLVFHGGEIQKNAMVYEMEINLIDQNTNSLKQFNQYFDRLAKEQKAKKQSWQEDTTDIDLE